MDLWMRYGRRKEEKGEKDGEIIRLIDVYF